MSPLLVAPTSAPEGPTSTSVESRSLTVQWGIVPCPDQRGPITGYRLRYSNGTSIVNTTGEGSRQHVLTGLTPFTSYSVQVAAVNAGGTGPYIQLSLWRHCRIVSNEQIIIVALLVCVPVQFLVQCLVCQPLQEWSSSQSHGLLPQNLMVSSQCIGSPTTALEY